MSNANQLVLPVQPGTLPQGFCPANYQDMLNFFARYMSVLFPDTFSGINVSSTKPTDTTKSWLQLDTLGRPVRLYYFAQGAWLSQHTLPTGFSMPWFGALPDFTVFDGGDSNTLSSISGPMWQQAVDINGKVVAAQFLIAAGALPSGKILSVGDSGGEENHLLTSAEAPITDHSHLIGFGATSDVLANTFLNGGVTLTGTIPSYEMQNRQQAPTQQPLTGTVNNPPSPAVSHNTLPPYTTVYFLQRTARLFYTVN